VGGVADKIVVIAAYEVLLLCEHVGGYWFSAAPSICLARLELNCNVGAQWYSSSSKGSTHSAAAATAAVAGIRISSGGM
jgi:hypothetical protein